MADEQADPKSGTKKISDPMADLFGAISSGIASGASSVWSGIKSGVSAVGGFFKEQIGERFANLFGEAGSFSTNKEVAGRAVANAAGNLGQLVAQLTVNLGSNEQAVAQIRAMQANGLLTEFDDERNAAYQQLAEQDAIGGRQATNVMFGEAQAAQAQKLQKHANVVKAKYHGGKLDDAIKYIEGTNLSADEKAMLYRDLSMLYGAWHSGKLTAAEQAQLKTEGQANLAAWQAEARQAAGQANQPNVFQRAWNWLTGGNDTAAGTGQYLPTGQQIMSQLPGHQPGRPIIWYNEAGQETGRANDHTGPVAIFSSGGATDTQQWTNMQSLSSRHVRTVEVSPGQFQDVGQPWRADVGGTGAWHGPNAEFQVMNVYTQTGWGGTVELRVGDDTLRYIHLNAISDEIYNARVNGGTGARLPAGSIVGYTTELRGNTTGSHLHVESTNRGHTQRDILQILQGRR